MKNVDKMACHHFFLNVLTNALNDGLSYPSEILDKQLHQKTLLPNLKKSFKERGGTDLRGIDFIDDFVGGTDYIHDCLYEQYGSIGVNAENYNNGIVYLLTLEHDYIFNLINNGVENEIDEII